MNTLFRRASFATLLVSLFFNLSGARAQSAGNSGTVYGTVTDPSGAIIQGAAVTIANPVSGYSRQTKTDTAGHYQFTNLPLNPYHLTISAPTFASAAADADVRSTVPITLNTSLKLSATSTMVEVTTNGGDLIEGDPVGHTDIDRDLFQKLPLESASSSLSSLVTLASPGVSADSDGLYHGMGDHASNTIAVDGQNMSDQQSKVFSNQIPSNSVQSLEVIQGAPPAEYGGKTSLVIQVTTRSGQGVTTPTGSVSASFGTFGSSTGSDNLNVQNVVSGGTGRSPVFGAVGNTDQRSKILTFNVAPTYTRTINVNSVFNLGAYVRRDDYNYYPSRNPLADLGPIQGQSVVQNRSLTNTGLHSDFSYVKGIHNIKLGAVYQQTFLRENDSIGLVDSTFNAPCLDRSGNSLPGFTSPTQCAGAGYVSNDPSAGGSYDSDLLPYDLTRGGGYFKFNGHTDVKELALYAQDQITAGNWAVNVGLRGDLYNGLSITRQAEPRVGLSHTVKRTNTVLRASYARTLETPFNENLVVSSQGCGSVVLSPLLACTPGVSTTLQPGFRNEFHAGLQQAFGKNFVVSGDYVWKYTHNAFDFSILGNTPIFFPIDCHNSKIPGFDLRADIPNIHHISAFVVMSSVAARFFPPQTAGAGATVGQSGYPFRIDHDEKFNETTHVQYSLPIKRAPWVGVNWRYDSGLVAASTPCFNLTGPNTGCSGYSILVNGKPTVDLSSLTADQQFEAGLACNGVKATPGSGFDQCPAAQLTSSLLTIPAPGTSDDDHNPPRVAPRSLFDVSLGVDNLLKGDNKHKWSLRLTAVNVTNKDALYNFLSTFSGTHYVTPRALTGEIGFHF